MLNSSKWNSWPLIPKFSWDGLRWIRSRTYNTSTRPLLSRRSDRRRIGVWNWFDITARGTGTHHCTAGVLPTNWALTTFHFLLVVEWFQWNGCNGFNWLAKINKGFRRERVRNNMFIQGNNYEATLLIVTL